MLRHCLLVVDSSRTSRSPLIERRTPENTNNNSTAPAAQPRHPYPSPSFLSHELFEFRAVTFNSGNWLGCSHSGDGIALTVRTTANKSAGDGGLTR
jgi:hypothetical protein